jgi:Domain of unknown function (DUF6436)
MGKCHKQAFAVLLLAVWLGISSLTLWWFQFRHISAFDRYWASFDGQLLNDIYLPPDMGLARVVHFIDVDCPCSRFSKRHIQTLEAHFSDRVQFQYKQEVPQDLWVPASPSVAVWDKHGKLAYVGPYSGGNLCGEGADFVSMTLNSLEQGFNPKWINSEAVGCFCRWPNKTGVKT